jgi:peptide deformylase
MAVRPIVAFPDPRLGAAAHRVENFDAGLRQLAGDLLDTLHAAPGIGITAPHVGILMRVVVLDLADGAGAQVYVNPSIEWASQDRIRHMEGSVSMPGWTETIERAADIRVAYQDLSGAARTEAATALRSVCLQHEIDQLEGIFWIERLSRLKRERLLRRFEKARRSGGGPQPRPASP